MTGFEPVISRLSAEYIEPAMLHSLEQVYGNLRTSNPFLKRCFASAL